jgi:hypothetical protein
MNVTQSKLWITNVRQSCWVIINSAAEILAAPPFGG